LFSLRTAEDLEKIQSYLEKK